MEVFFTLLGKLIPLYLVILLGYIAGRMLRVQKESVAALLIYIIAPVVVFHGVVTTELTPGLLFLPVFFFLVCSFLGFSFLLIGGRIFGDGRKNILAFMAGTGNTGYFGLPVSLALFGDSVLGIVVLSTLGLILYENSLGFYFTARGNHATRESIAKVIRLPAMYAFLLGLAIHFLDLPLGSAYEAIAVNFRGAYSVLGMMLIGLGIAGMERFELDLPFLSLAFAAKFLAWPALILFFVFLDRSSLHLYSSEIHRVLFLLSVVPLAANSVAVATELKVEPGKAAVAVLFSTLAALLIIPILATFLL